MTFIFIGWRGRTSSKSDYKQTLQINSNQTRIKPDRSDRVGRSLCQFWLPSGTSLCFFYSIFVVYLLPFEEDVDVVTVFLLALFLMNCRSRRVSRRLGFDALLPAGVRSRAVAPQPSNGIRIFCAVARQLLVLLTEIVQCCRDITTARRVNG